MFDNNILLDLLNGKAVSRPPVWLMRQAGRILPQYRAIRKDIGDFKALVKNPDLAAEVTIQPVDELGVDAAIIFSDILVVPEAMGLDYELIEKVGPRFPQTIETEKDIRNLVSGECTLDHLTYVFDALKETKKRLNGRVPIIGFCGAPWTLFTYMIEGKGTKVFAKARNFLYSHEKQSKILLDKISDSLIVYLKEQIKSGADVVQIFDSWAGVLNPTTYQEIIIPYFKKIRDSITEVPVIIFAKGAWHSLDSIQNQCKPNVLGIDWTTPASWARKVLGSNQILQGNLDPALLYGPEDQIENAVNQLILDFEGQHIFNLGHGVYPDTDLEKVKLMVDSIQRFHYK